MLLPTTCVRVLEVVFLSWCSFMSSEGTSGVCQSRLQGPMGARLQRPRYKGRPHPGQDKVLSDTQPAHTSACLEPRQAVGSLCEKALF